MFVDERIALLERYQRQMESEEQKVEEEEKEILTLEQAKLAIEKEYLEYSNREKLEFEKKVYLPEKIQMPILKNFYDSFEEQEECVIYINCIHEISQILMYSQENMQESTLQQWKKILVNGMLATGMYADVVKIKQLEHIEYICYSVPSKKGEIYNIIFRMRGKNRKVTGNFNCLKKEQGFYGVILEAMIIKMDEWISKSQ